jgi:hypothetical protein
MVASLNFQNANEKVKAAGFFSHAEAPEMQRKIYLKE